MKNKSDLMNRLIKIGCVSILLVLASAAFAGVFFYDALFEKLAHMIGGDENAEKIGNYVPVERFLYLLWYAFAMCVILAGWVLLYSRKHITGLKIAFRDIYARSGQTIRAVPARERTAVLLLIGLHTAIGVYYAGRFPVTNDEAFTFLNYVDRGFAAAATLYNEPNNHILYSLLANVTDLIPFLDTSWKLRLPSLLIGTLSCGVFYLLARRVLGSRIALFSLFIWTLFYLTAKYHFLARGYGLMMFFYLTGFYAYIMLIKDRRDYTAKFIYFISCILGFYTHPAFLIPFVAFIASDLLLYRRRFRKTAMLNFPIVLITAGLYAPLIILNGTSAFTSNSGIAREGFMNLLLSIKTNLTGVITQSGYDTPVFWVPTVILIFAGSIKHRKALFVKHFYTALVIVFAVLIATGSALFIRNLLWLTVPVALIAGGYFTGVSRFTDRLFWSVAGALAIGFIAVRTILFPQVFDKYYAKLYKAYDFTAALPADYGTLYCTHKSDYYTILRYSADHQSGKSGELIRRNFDPEFPYAFLVNVKKDREHYEELSEFDYRKVYEDKYVELYGLAEAP